MSDIIHLSNARLCFPVLIEAQSFQDSAPRFSCDLVFPKTDTAQIQRVMAAVGQIANEKWKEHANAVMSRVQSERKLRSWGAGEEKINNKTMQVYDGYGDGFYLTCSSTQDKPPTIIRSSNGTPVDNSNTLERTAEARKLYGGCYVNAAVRFWAQDNQFGRAVRCQLLAIQFLKDGQAFGEAPPDFTGMFGATSQGDSQTPSEPPRVKQPWEL